jgi:DNA transposition AAA+ family ATPase
MPNETMERLREGQRVLGPMRLVRDGQQVTAEAAKQVVENVAAFIREHGLSWGKIARAIGCHGAALSNIVNFKYAGNWQQIILDLDVWLEDEIKRQAGPPVPPFVLTGIAREIFTVAECAVAMKTIGVIFGEQSSGFGKTMALRAFAAQKPGTIFISVETVRTAPSHLAGAIAEAMCVYLGQRAAGTGESMGRIKTAVRGTARLLIVDEIHKLCIGNTDRGLHFLRDLHDQTGMPMLWCGTKDLMAYLERRQVHAREPLAQIRSRIGICRDLTDRGAAEGGQPIFTADEIRRAFGGSKMKLTADAVRYLCELANLPDSGGLRVCHHLVTMATRINELHTDTLNAPTLRGAHQLLIDRKSYHALESQMEEFKPRLARAVPA